MTSKTERQRDRERQVTDSRKERQREQWYTNMRVYTNKAIILVISTLHKQQRWQTQCHQSFTNSTPTANRI